MKKKILFKKQSFQIIQKNINEVQNENTQFYKPYKFSRKQATNIFANNL